MKKYIKRSRGEKVWAYDYELRYKQVMNITIGIALKTHKLLHSHSHSHSPGQEKREKYDEI